jgi:di/tricarboxylate transporter
MNEGFTTEVLLTLGVTIGALALFVWNRLRVDVVGLIVMATLIVTGLVTPREGISGFSNEALITVAAMFILSAGLLRTGAIDMLGRWTARVARGEFGLLAVSLLLVIPLSAFINNTPVVVVMIPLVLGLARKMQIAPSRLFMPISFASQMGGTLTLIGTSTNLLVAGLVLELGMERIRLFDITPPALVLTALGVTYLLTAGRALTPTRETETDLLGSYDLRRYLTGLIVRETSPVAGRSLRDSRFASQYGLQVIGVDRAGTRVDFPRGGFVVEPGDVLIVEGQVSDIARIEQIEHLQIAGTQPNFPAAAAQPAEGSAGQAETRLAELIVPPRSPLVGRTLRQLNFRNRYGVPVLGVQRHGVPLHDRLRDVVLEPGDILLVSGTNADLNGLHRSNDVALLGAVRLPARRLRKLKYSVAIIASVVLLAAFDITPILVSAILGVIAMFLTGCITPDEAYEEIDWMVLVLLGAIIPLGLAMQNTGTAELLAGLVVRATEPLGLYGVLATFYLLTSVLTELISNNAAAVVLTPVAIATALTLGASPMPFIVAVMFAASNSFMTPIGYQTNTFIYGPGGYRFVDFIRVGGPLNVLMIAASTFVIPFFFPF